MPSDGEKKGGASAHFPTPLVPGIAIIVASILVLASYFLLQSREILLNRAANNAETISNVLGQFVLTAIHEPEVLLQMASDEYRRELHAGTFNAKTYGNYLSVVRKRIPIIANLRVADASGQIGFSDSDALDRPVDISDRPYFNEVRDTARKFVISPPVLGRISQEWVIPVAWRLDGPDGRFDGLLVANLSAKRFIDLFASLKAGPNSAIILFDSNTSINLRHPEPRGAGSAIGLKIGSPEFKALWLTGIRSATYRAQSTTDGIWRTYSYRQIGDYPLFIMVGVAEEDVLAPWRSQIAVTVAFLLGLGLLLVWLLRSLADSISRQRQAYRELEGGRIQLEESESALNHAQRVAEVGSWRLELLGNKLVWSDETYRIFGLKTGTPVTYQDFLSHVAPEDRSAVDVAWQEALKGSPYDIAHRILVSGNIRWVRERAQLVFDAGGKLLGGVGTVQDITERKRAEDDLERYRFHLEELVQQRTNEVMQMEAKAVHILESSADGLYGVDRDGKINFINPAACQMLGWTAEQVVGHSAHALFHHSKPDGSPYPVEECPSHMALQRGHEVRVDNEVYWHADGHAVPVMFSAHPMIQGGNVGGAVISFVDMSEQRAAALARERAIVAAENLARVRSEFLSNMSHEIRTPINGVLGFAEIGYRNCHDSEKARNAFEKILMSGKRLLGVINDILDFSKVEAGKLQIEQIPFALNEMIEQTVDVVRDLARAKHLDLRVESAANLPQACVGDPLRIGQILLNLLSNAVKFTEKGSVTLATSCADETLLFRVIDTGIGMNEDQMRQLFIPFQQGDGSLTRRFGGTGLGLTIAKRIAELMEADIRVESQPGKGSTFEFRLPYVHADAPLNDLFSAAEPGAAAGKRLAGVTVLVAEDEPINRAILELSLTEDGARVVMVHDGQQAVERILQDGRAAYDIVLMDMQMPVLGGLDATRRILELAPDLPIIGQTANAFAEDREKCLAAGMTGYIAKPFDSEALVSLVLQQVKAQRNV